jgi:hypothetical protein
MATGRVIRLAIVSCASAVLALGCATTKHSDASLKDELEAMCDSDQADQAERNKIEAARKQYGYNSPQEKALWLKQRRIDEANIKRLEEIIRKSGWPGPRLVGDKASLCAFLVLQHADLSYQKKYLPLLRKAAADKELPADRLALLEDRVLVREGKKQLYGSQLHPNAQGVLEFCPIEDEANVDKRRQAVGLGPLSDYAKQQGLEYHPR